MLQFEPIALCHRDLLEPYLHRYGEGSCQHSFPAMFCMSEKYGDRFCLRNGFLLIHRSRQSTLRERVYLFPLGDPADRAGLVCAVEALLEDARSHGSRLCFRTVTAQAKGLLQDLFPGQFRAEECRDYAEYLYTAHRLAELPGHEMSSKRHDINSFNRLFGDCTLIETIQPHHLPDILAFQEHWLRDYLAGEEDVQLDLEHTAIRRGLTNFARLGLSGIVVHVNGKLAGYAYGAPLSPTHYDVLIEKGDRRIPHIYRILNQELVRRCCRDFAFINREEDVGVEGLRQAKLSYKPDCLMKKYLVWEVDSLE